MEIHKQALLNWQRSSPLPPPWQRHVREHFNTGNTVISAFLLQRLFANFPLISSSRVAPLPLRIQSFRETDAAERCSISEEKAARVRVRDRRARQNGRDEERAPGIYE